MQMLGLIGGTSWHSTIEYYRHINQQTNAHFGNNTSPPLVLNNLNQAEIHQLQKSNNWDAITNIMITSATQLQSLGAKAVLFCANTPHMVFDMVERHLKIPIIHIADATAMVINEMGLSKVGLIGTRFTMEFDFLVNRFAMNNIEVLTPSSQKEIAELHRIIHEELSFGKIVDGSKKFVLSTIQRMVDQGAQGCILGCTEFPLMIGPEDMQLPFFNTTLIHASAGVDFILSE